MVTGRIAWLLAFLALPACGLRAAGSLRDENVRLQLSGQLVATLQEQHHYFASEADRQLFELRLRHVAEQSRDARTYYSALSDALASLDEGHTGLVGSVQVPFCDTIPPVALVEADDQAVIAGVAPGIEGGGLRCGDVVLRVDGAPALKVLTQRMEVTPGSTVHGRRARALANLLAGPTGEPAEVEVRGVDGRVRHCFPLRFLLDDEGMDRFRFGFLPQTVTLARITPSAAYIALPDFHPDRRAQLEEALQAVGSMPTLILDLRGNPGGRIRTLQRIAGMFFDEPVELLLLREGTVEEYLRARPGPVYYRGSLRVLVDSRTGSAAELLAAALQDLNRARVYGATTAGSARSRLSLLLPGQVVLHYAGRSEFRHRDGRPIEGVGIEPDVRHEPERAQIAHGVYGDPYLDPLVRLALGQN